MAGALLAADTDVEEDDDEEGRVEDEEDVLVDDTLVEDILVDEVFVEEEDDEGRVEDEEDVLVEDTLVEEVFVEEDDEETVADLLVEEVDVVLETTLTGNDEELVDETDADVVEVDDEAWELEDVESELLLLDVDDDAITKVVVALVELINAEVDDALDGAVDDAVEEDAPTLYSSRRLLPPQYSRGFPGQ